MSLREISRLLAAIGCLCWAAAAHPGDFSTRAELREFIDRVAGRHGFDPGELEAVLGEARFLPAVIRAIQPPTEPRQRSWQAYRERFLDSRRIDSGVEFWMRHQEGLARAQSAYGVPASVIVAILGIETVYGRNVGRFQTLSALATLAFDYPPRAELFRRELESLLLLARDQGRSPLAYRGSYAGALGLPQFLPSSYREFAVDFDGDGRIDLWNSTDDVLGSVASFLARHGWRQGGPIATPATATEELGQRLAEEGIVPLWSVGELEALGVSVDTAAGAEELAAMIDLATPDRPTEYWLGFHNFYVITRYNRSSFYAMAVFQLSGAIERACGQACKAMPPTAARP